MKFDTSYLKASRLLTWLASCTLSLFIIILPWGSIIWSHSSPNAVSDLLGASMIVGGFIPVFLLLIVLHFFINKPENQVRLNPMDWLVILSGLFILGHCVYVGLSDLDPFLIIRIISIYTVYWLIRVCKMYLKWILLSYLISIFLQSLYGVFEYFQPMVSSTFLPVNEINGSFFNSGPFGGYMALGVIMCAGILSYKQFLHIKWIICMLNVPIVVCCILSESRAAWIAAFVGVLYFVWIRYGDKLVNGFRNRPIRIGFILMVGGVLLFLAGTSLYSYKKDSADGRLLIWKNTLDMMGDNFLLGAGPGQFAARYMHYQSDHFQLFEDSRQSILAGDTSYAFNEMLRIGVEYGLAGVLLLSIFVFIIFNKKIRLNSEYFPSQVFVGQAVLIGFGVFALFSYPSSVLPLLMVFVIMTGVISNGFMPVFTNAVTAIGERVIRNFRYGFILSLCLVNFCYISFFRETKYAYQIWHTSTLEFNTDDYTNDLTIAKLESVHPVLLNNGLFLSMYGRILTKSGDYKRAISILDSAGDIAPTTQVYLDIGDAFKGLSFPDSAAAQYLYAHKMIPGRIKPYYKLAKLYRDLGQKEKMKKIINQYVHRKYIKRTLASYEYELEMKDWLEE